MLKLMLFASLLAACQCMQQVTYGYQQPGPYQYQKPFTAFRQVQPQPQPEPQPQPLVYQQPEPAPQPLVYQQPAPYQYQQPQTYVYQQPQPYQYQAYQPQPAPYQQPYQQLAYQPQPAALAPAVAVDDMMMDHDMMMMKEPAAANALVPAPAPAPAPEPVPHEPMYLGTFSKARNNVEGDIFMLDERTLYIQGFSFDGQAPDVYFWADGVAIPYYTRSNPNVQTIVGRYNKEDLVLLLPPEKPTVHQMGHFAIWCRQFDVTFGEFSMNNLLHHAA